MVRAAVAQEFTMPDFPQVEVGVLEWPLTVLRLSCAERGPLLDAACHVLERSCQASLAGQKTQQECRDDYAASHDDDETTHVPHLIGPMYGVHRTHRHEVFVARACE